MVTFIVLVEALMDFNSYFLLFAFCILMFQVCSKLAIELCENTGNTSSPIYLASIVGIFSSLHTGAMSLYRMVKLVEKEGALAIWPEK